MPLSVNPWAEERTDVDLPPVIKVLRGDFFCMPFGLNEQPWGGEKHPVHGESANAKWSLQSAGRIEHGFEFRAFLKTAIRAAKVEKVIRLMDNQPVVYCRHIISGLRGPMNFGHHALLRFPSGTGTGLVATSPFAFGQVFPADFEDPRKGGYSSLKPGARFHSLARVANRFGGYADLSSYPAREGYDDLVMLVTPSRATLAWSAVTFPTQCYTWFALRDPSVLRQTVLWHSNGGRHYAPWSGRHRYVLGIEEITGNFHWGLKESVARNPISRFGSATSRWFRPDKPLTVNYIMAVTRVPKGFDHVADIRLASGKALLRSRSGKLAEVLLDAEFLYGKE
jgi:hypothetical protein